MIRAVKPGEKYSTKIKYIIIDDRKKICSIVAKSDEGNLTNVLNILEGNLIDYRIIKHSCLKIDKEIKLIWPQIVNETTKKFPCVKKWLTDAKLKIKENYLTIVTDTKLAFKNISKDMFKNIINNRLQYYLAVDIKIRVEKTKDREQSLHTVRKKLIKDNNIKKKKNDQNNIIYGKLIKDKPTHKLNDLTEQDKSVIICGEVFSYQEKQTRNSKKLIIISITDKNTSLTVKLFVKNRSELRGKINHKNWLKIRGNVRYDNYSNEIIVIASDINIIKNKKRNDNAPEKRIELHLHTQMSAMDSVVNVNEVIERAAEWEHPALAITDHGVVQAFPDAYSAGQKNTVKIIYGLEAYMVDDGEPIIINEDNKAIRDTTFVIFDLETTGLHPKRDEIIEIGAVKIRGGEKIDEFSSFVKPSGDIPPKITDLTGIREEMVANAPSIKEAGNNFLEFSAGTVLVAHNAEFDYGFLQADFPDINFSVLDTLSLSRVLLKNLNNYRLDTIAAYCNVNLENHHRAVDDALATSEIFIMLINMLKEKGILNLNEINNLVQQADWKKLHPYHTTILALNQKGLKDLYHLVSNSHLKHFYRKPRILKSELTKYRDNLLIGSACEAGQLFRAILYNKPGREIKEIVKFYDYLELQPLANNNFLIPEHLSSREELIDLYKQIYNLGKKYNKPVVATGDVHFLDPGDEIFREILQTGQGYEEPHKQPPLYYKTTEEMLADFAFMGKKIANEIVIGNTHKINDMIKEIKPIPEGLFTPEIKGAAEKIRKMVFSNARKMYGENLPDIVARRLEKELKAIIDNGYAVIYLISQKLVQKSLDEGYLVGSRGSVGSSLVATMCGITEVNPLPAHYYCPQCHYMELNKDDKYSTGIDLPDKNCPQCGSKYIKTGYDIPFEIFMGFKGDKVPDIDLNFSGEYQSTIHQETEKIFGKDYVFRAGTISTIAERTAFGFVRGYIDDNGKNLRKAEVNRLVQGCTGTRRTTGQHPGGIMVVPRSMDIHNFTPIQHPANDQETDVRTTHFDYHSISGHILKLDLLGHDDPTSLKMLEKITGVDPNSIPLDDQDTMSIFSGTDVLNVDPEDIGTEVGTLGIPEFGTSFVRQMLVETRPSTFAELIRISGLSHGTDVWLNNARNLIKKGKAKLSEVISVRDDIMNYLIDKGVEPEKSFWIMEHVRKGKGLTEEEKKIMKEFNVPEWYINSCKKIKYMFPKAHASAYVMMAFRIAYFKVHYPEGFYLTYFSTNADNFDAQLISRGYEYIVKKKEEILNKGNNATTKEKDTLTVLEIVIEAMLRGINFLHVDLYKSDAKKFKLEQEGLLPPLISLSGLGESAAESILEYRKKGRFSSIEDLINKTGISKTVVEVMKEHGTLANLPEKNQLALF